MNTNTLKSTRKSSTVYASRIEDTKKNLKAKMAAAGCTDYKMVKVYVPQIPGTEDDVLFIGLNGQKFYFLRGGMVDMPEQLASIYTKSGNP